MSSRAPLVFSDPFGPAEKLPAASSPVVVAGLTTIRFGRSGRVLLLAEELLRRGDQLAPRGDLGAVVQGDRHQLVGRLLGGDERDLEERRLDRLEQRGRVEQEDLRQPGAGDPPVADGDLLGLPEALELGPAPG